MNNCDQIHSCSSYGNYVTDATWLFLTLGILNHENLLSTNGQKYPHQLFVLRVIKEYLSCTHIATCFDESVQMGILRN